MNEPAAGLDFHRDRPAACADRDLQRQLSDVGLQVIFALPTSEIQALAKISLAVKQSDADQRNSQIGRALNMVARKDTEPPGINRKRFVYSEFRGEIGHRTRPQDRGMPRSPGAVGLQIFLQPAIGVVNAAVQYKFRGATLQLEI